MLLLFKTQKTSLNLWVELKKCASGNTYLNFRPLIKLHTIVLKARQAVCN